MNLSSRVSESEEIGHRFLLTDSSERHNSLAVMNFSQSSWFGMVSHVYITFCHLHHHSPPHSPSSHIGILNKPLPNVTGSFNVWSTELN